MIRVLLLTVGSAALIAGPAYALTPKQRAQRAVVAEVKREYTIRGFDTRVDFAASCRRLTAKRFKCTWDGTYRSPAYGRMERWGKARVTLHRYNPDVRLYDEACSSPEDEYGCE